VYRRFLRPSWVLGHLLVVLAVLICLRLGLWQWHRTHEADGTVQNLGYTVLWPVFGVAFVYMWFRFLQLETLKDAEDDAELTELAAGESTGNGSGDTDVWHRSATAAESVDETMPPADPTSSGQRSEAVPPSVDVSGSVGADEEGDTSSQPVVPAPAASRRPPSRGYTVAVSTVGDENEEEEPELAAYNRALAALAEKDHRRAR